MKGNSAWSQVPYVRAFEKEKEFFPHIIRLMPSEFSFSFDWFDKGDSGAHAVFLKKKTDATFNQVLTDSTGRVVVENLSSDEEYEFYIQAKNGNKSTVRLFRTGKDVPNGSVLTYLHPKDKTFKHTGYAIGAPSIVKLSSGKLLSSVGVFIDRSTWAVEPLITQIFSSIDDGNTWDYECDIVHSLNGSLFVHQGRLYFLALYADYGDLCIAESKDEGKTWSAPVVIAKGEGPKGWGWHLMSNDFVEHKGRIYHQLEYGHVAVYPKDSIDAPNSCMEMAGRLYDLAHHLTVLSINCDADLLNAENWTISDLYYPKEYDPYQCIEGNILENPKGELVEIFRTMKAGVSLITKIDTKNPHNAMSPLGETTKFPLGAVSKFSIKRDAKTGCYIAFGNDRWYGRHRLVMAVSKDLDNWEMVYEIANGDGTENYYSYPDWIFSGEDVYLLARSAHNGAVNGHDTNCITFHKIKNFRQYFGENLIVKSNDKTEELNFMPTMV